MRNHYKQLHLYTDYYYGNESGLFIFWSKYNILKQNCFWDCLFPSSC